MTTNCIVILTLICLLAISMLANILLVEKLEKANEKLEAMKHERKW